MDIDLTPFKKQLRRDLMKRDRHGVKLVDRLTFARLNAIYHSSYATAGIRRLILAAWRRTQNPFVDAGDRREADVRPNRK